MPANSLMNDTAAGPRWGTTYASPPLMAPDAVSERGTRGGHTARDSTALDQVQVLRYWHWALRRRSQTSRATWAWVHQRPWFTRPAPRVLHPEVQREKSGVGCVNGARPVLKGVRAQGDQAGSPKALDRKGQPRLLVLWLPPPRPVSTYRASIHEPRALPFPARWHRGHSSQQSPDGQRRQL